MGKIIDLTGQRFGRLVVVKRVDNKGQHPAWLCKCDCGNECIVTGSHLKSGHSQSCGCLQKERTSKSRKRHGLCDSRQYSIWTNMKSRCSNQEDHAYKYYGGRGITVCDEWKSDFQAFYYWAMANGYQDNLTLDRIDVNGNYEPSNCRWVSMKEQSLNKRSNHLITYNGETLTITQWADRLGIDKMVLFARINDYHWDIEKALTKTS